VAVLVSYAFTIYQRNEDDQLSAGRKGGASYLDVLGSTLDAQESALQNLERAETLREYVLKLFTGAKMGERERFVLLADGSHCFGFAANITDVRYHELSS
jgi:hypothetical protein